MANLGDLTGAATEITSGIELNTLVKETLDFFLRHLSGWRDDPERVRRIPKKSSTAACATI